LAWEAPEKDGGSLLEGYYIYYKQTNAAITVWQKTSSIGKDLNQNQITGLSENLMFSFKIVAYNVKGESEQSGVLYRYSCKVPTQL
jgi:hypothetical protein